MFRGVVFRVDPERDRQVMAVELGEVVDRHIGETENNVVWAVDGAIVRVNGRAQVDNGH